MKKALVSIFLLLFTVTIYAQEENQACATSVPSDRWENEFQKLISENKIKQKRAHQPSQVYTIPIIFHIIHGGQAIDSFPNISKDQVNSQIVVLNQDFSGNGYNSSNYPSDAFVNWAINESIPSTNIDSIGRVKIADVGIQFCLATKDSLGNILPEPGINRLNYQNLNLANPVDFPTQASMKSYLDNRLKPLTIWDVTKYLNVWITDKNTALNYNGVASIPPLSGLTDLTNNSTDSTDGIWCYAKVIGSNNLYSNGIYGSTMVGGRTLTHEIGHYLGLRHISGDAACATDYCDDTPPAAAQNTGAPSYPLNVGSCSSPTNNPDGEMFMNFMDYPWDPYKYMFTTDQATRMHTAMQNSPYRNQLGTHNLCTVPLGITNEESNHMPSIYPNPAQTEVNINILKNEIDEVVIRDLFGKVLIKTKNQNHIEISDLPNGVYMVSITKGQFKQSHKLIKWN